MGKTFEFRGVAFCGRPPVYKAKTHRLSDTPPGSPRSVGRVPWVDRPTIVISLGCVPCAFCLLLSTVVAWGAQAIERASEEAFLRGLRCLVGVVANRGGDDPASSLAGLAQRSSL